MAVPRPLPVGSRVRVCRPIPDTSFGIRLTDAWGTVRGNISGHAAVEFDVRVAKRNDCEGRCRSGYGWWVLWEDLALEPSSPFEKSVMDYIDRELGQ